MATPPGKEQKKHQQKFTLSEKSKVEIIQTMAMLMLFMIVKVRLNKTGKDTHTHTHVDGHVVFPRKKRKQHLNCNLKKRQTISEIFKFPSIDFCWYIHWCKQCFLFFFLCVCFFFPFPTNKHLGKFIYIYICVTVCIYIYMFFTHIYINKTSPSPLTTRLPPVGFGPKQSPRPWWKRRSNGNVIVSPVSGARRDPRKEGIP